MASETRTSHSPTADYSPYTAEPPAYPVGDVELGRAASGAANIAGGKGGTNGEPHRRLSTGSSASAESSINENLEVASVTSSIEDKLTWRGRMQVTMHSHTFHLFIIALVVLDALIVLFELLLDLGAFNNIECEGEGIVEQAEFCHYRQRERCGPPAILLLERTNISATPDLPDGSPGVGESGLCSCGFTEGRRTCSLGGELQGVNPALVLHGISLFILSVFMVEIGLKLAAFRLKYFLPSTHHLHGRMFYFITFEMFDGLVVIISWILDIASLEEEEAFELIDLVIILRLWRIVRVVNGAVLSAKAQLDQQLHEARHHARHVITALHKAQDKIELLEKDNQVFRKRLVQNTDSNLPPPPEIRVDSPSVFGGDRTREE